MATTTFLGSGTPSGQFTIDDQVVRATLIPGEYRLQRAFPYPSLEMWRRNALAASATINAIDTRCRTTVLFAHEADLGSLFLDLTGTTATELAGHYNFKQKAVAADAFLVRALSLKDKVLAELKQLNVPDQHRELLRTRLESPAFVHRVAGVCAAVYLASLLIEQAEAQP